MKTSSAIEHFVTTSCSKLKCHLMNKLQRLTTPDLELMDRFYRANLINSLSGYKNASLIGSLSDRGVSNLAIFNSVFHIGANPSLIGYINRPLESSKHTFTNILSNKHYTINHIPSQYYRQAHQTSAKYPEGVSEFDPCGFKEEYLGDLKAPYVAEAHIKYGLELKEIVPIKLNGSYMIIGEVKEIYFKEGLLNDDGFLDANEAESVCSLGLDTYYKTERLGRLPYAKP